MNPPKGTIEGAGRRGLERWGPWGVAAALAIAAALRLGHVLALRGLPLFDHLIIDSKLYDGWAQRIAAGDWLGGDRAFYMDPLYPYLLGVLYRFMGHDLMAARLAQVALGVGTCGLVAWSARRLGGWAVAVPAAAFVALYGPLVFEEGEIEKTALGVFLVAAFIAFASGGGRAARLGAGLALGLASLTRGNLLLLAPLAAVHVALAGPPGDSRAPTQTGSRRPWVPYASRVATFGLGFALALGPVIWRNHRVSGEWVLTTSQLGQNFYTGNNPSNATGAYTPVPFVRPLPEYEEADFKAKAEAQLGRPLGPREVSSYWFRAGLEHLREHPGFALQVFLRKAALTVADLEVPDGWSFYFLRRFSTPLQLAFLTFGWLLPLAVLGVAATALRDPVTRVATGFVAVYALTLVVFFVFSRYRIYLVPAIALLAAAGLRSIVELVVGRRWRRLAAAAGVAALVAAGSFSAARAAGLSRDDYVHNYAHLAEIHAARGEYGRAVALLEEAEGLRPGTAAIQKALGVIRLELGDVRGAIVNLERAARADPDYPEVWFLLGTAHEAAGDPGRARQAYMTQLDRTPGHQASWAGLKRLAGAVPGR